MRYTSTDTKIRNIREKVNENGFLNKILPIGLIIFFVLYYLPVMPVFSDKISGEELVLIWDKVYKVLDPFVFMPYVMGLVSVFITIAYRKIWFKIVYFLFYIISIMFSLMMVMGMTSIWELLVFLPHVVCLIIDAVLALRYKNIV